MDGNRSPLTAVRLKCQDSPPCAGPLVSSRPVQTVRTALAGAVAFAALIIGAPAAAAQTTTTVPPVPAIPVTDGTTATTTAPAVSGEGSRELAQTGMAADLLVPFAFGLIGGGAVLQATARRRPRNAYGLL